MSARSKVLVVDDEPFNREIMQDILEPEYDVSYAASGQECLDIVETLQPGLILLDISMPGMSGYEVCKRLKSESCSSDIPVTFVSALDTLAERLTGYEVGGDDYITKPFEAKELTNKVEVAIKIRETQKGLREQTDKVLSTAMTAISSSGELGNVLQFLDSSFACDDYDSLARLTIDSLLSIGLRTTVQIRGGKNTMTLCSDGALNPLESMVMARLCQEDRIIDIGPRTIINFPYISVLIKGMPLNEAEKYDRVKNNIALLVEAADARLKAIDVQTNLDRQRKGLLCMAESTQNTLEKIAVEYEDNKIKSMGVLAELVANVEKSFSWMELSKEQETRFLSMVNDSVNTTIELYRDGLGIDETMTEVLLELENIMNDYDV